MKEFTESYLNEGPSLLRSGPPVPATLCLVTRSDLLDNGGMTFLLDTLLLRTGAFHAFTFAAVRTALFLYSSRRSHHWGTFLLTLNGNMLPLV